ncbi:hypothetical protein JQC92_08825 [Shewanella sp. 202IG2-18]|uniref:hypothetical protein n=1 Tax=Parashewanella hymeniacidonis TaxID=2807618 RepID=UPI0019602226|nr:hypothetical protein [Parashewanella hymeniacidonis]MBM7072131.1 hypothetical protein [Parashewanella hymeniacidonis]
MLKKLLIGIGIIIIIPLFIALMLDNEYEVEKNIIIDQPITQVFSYIKLLIPMIPEDACFRTFSAPIL